MKKSYDGFAMLPLTIEHGGERTRLLAKPEVKLPINQPRGKETEENALAYMRSTAFTEPPLPNAPPPDLSQTDGHLRLDDPWHHHMRAAIAAYEKAKAEQDG
jgi:hypothetical protein